MGTQYRIPSPPLYPHASHSITSPQNHVQSHSNGIHPDSSRPRYSAPSNEHISGNDMPPYPYEMSNGASQSIYQQQQSQSHHQQYSRQSAQQPPQQNHQEQQYQPQRQYLSQNQLPPLSTGMGMPHSMSAAPPVQHAVAAPPPPQHTPIWPATTGTTLPQLGARAVETQNHGGPTSLSGRNAKYRFELRVEQQPARARMCGFGDKDRRPITPPPCVRLLVYDVHTDKLIPHEDLDGNFYVLQVDLWDETATREVNIVRSTSQTPSTSISASSTTSFPPTDGAPPGFFTAQVRPGIYANEHGMTVYGNPTPYGTQLTYTRPLPDPRAVAPNFPGSAYRPGAQLMPVSTMPLPIPISQNATTTMFTRNLIGSLTVNACTLEDTEKKWGLWFVLQDLSVRTEGWFRLRMSLIDIADPSGDGLNKGRCPVLAYGFSEKFQVYSAKKFPGVIESTPLSKTFADQGIKIPIRKDNKDKAGNKDDDDNDEESDD